MKRTNAKIIVEKLIGSSINEDGGQVTVNVKFSPPYRGTESVVLSASAGDVEYDAIGKIATMLVPGAVFTENDGELMLDDDVLSDDLVDLISGVHVDCMTFKGTTVYDGYAELTWEGGGVSAFVEVSADQKGKPACAMITVDSSHSGPAAVFCTPAWARKCLRNAAKDRE